MLFLFVFYRYQLKVATTTYIPTTYLQGVSNSMGHPKPYRVAQINGTPCIHTFQAGKITNVRFDKIVP